MTRQPELRATPNGTSVTTFTIGVNRFKKDDDVDFVDVVCWGRLAEIVAEWGYKGRLVAVEGRLQSRKYTTRDGVDRQVWEIIADNVQFMGRGNDD